MTKGLVVVLDSVGKVLFLLVVAGKVALVVREADVVWSVLVVGPVVVVEAVVVVGAEVAVFVPLAVVVASVVVAAVDFKAHLQKKKGQSK